MKILIQKGFQLNDNTITKSVAPRKQLASGTIYRKMESLVSNQNIVLIFKGIEDVLVCQLSFKWAHVLYVNPFL